MANADFSLNCFKSVRIHLVHDVMPISQSITDGVEARYEFFIAVASRQSGNVKPLLCFFQSFQRSRGRAQPMSRPWCHILYTLRKCFLGVSATHLNSWRVNPQNPKHFGGNKVFHFKRFLKWLGTGTTWKRSTAQNARFGNAHWLQWKILR